MNTDRAYEQFIRITQASFKELLAPVLMIQLKEKLDNAGINRINPEHTETYLAKGYSFSNHRVPIQVSGKGLDGKTSSGKAAFQLDKLVALLAKSKAVILDATIELRFLEDAPEAKQYSEGANDDMVTGAFAVVTVHSMTPRGLEYCGFNRPSIK